MAYLLDTHLLVWLAVDSPRLSGATADLVTDPHTAVYFSVVSLWEIVIKTAPPQRGLDVDASRLRSGALAAGFREITVHAHHVLAVARLPALHADPFDRLLLAQATVEGMRMLTTDAAVLRYGSPAEQA